MARLLAAAGGLADGLAGDPAPKRSRKRRVVLLEVGLVPVGGVGEIACSSAVIAGMVKPGGSCSPRRSISTTIKGLRAPQWSAPDCFYELTQHP